MCGHWSRGSCHSFSPLINSSSSNTNSGDGCKGESLKGAPNERGVLHQSQSWRPAVGSGSNGSHGASNGIIRCKWFESWSENQSPKQPWRWTLLTWKDRTRNNDSDLKFFTTNNNSQRPLWAGQHIHAKLCDEELCRYKKIAQKPTSTACLGTCARKQRWKENIAVFISDYLKRINEKMKKMMKMKKKKKKMKKMKKKTNRLFVIIYGK